MAMLWTYGIGTLVLAGSAASGTWMLAVKSQSPRPIPIHKEPERPFERVVFEGTASLQGWFIWGKGNSPAKRAPVIVISHGWGSNRARVMRYAIPLVDAGFNVLVYDVTSHGESGAVKAPSALLFRDDMLAAVRYVRQRQDVDPDRIAVLGHSLGGFGAVLALEEGLNVRAIVTDSMPSRPLSLVEAELKRRKLPSFPLAVVIPRIWLYRSRIPVAVYDGLDVGQILADHHVRTAGRIPVYMVHSRLDGFIPPSELEQLVERLPYEQSHLFVDTNGHSCSETDSRFWAEVISFFRRQLDISG
ncbi:alpha/beta hydrolase [Paenibacillus sp. NAIST15-1]|uniref:alpha/beta hydrolase n=1 Tax=Paenibacillus sp. NAIST15-1 TaxID=1605994 RepID=UPI00086D7F5F|nr:alpha/beta fold hydrolase [Paenibacillus sp. NAIST15-1]GAV10567.1 hypothetical protein PBN151_0477 [Paenibacillus sp. NAIST15-1]